MKRHVDLCRESHHRAVEVREPAVPGGVGRAGRENLATSGEAADALA